jgi:L-iditol 2-dehydrogenase
MNSAHSKMLAAQILGPQKIMISEVSVPTPEPDDVLVKVMSCGICPSDVRFYQGSSVERLRFL